MLAAENFLLFFKKNVLSYMKCKMINCAWTSPHNASHPWSPAAISGSVCCVFICRLICCSYWHSRPVMFRFTDFSHCSSKSAYPQVWKNSHWSFLEYWSCYKQMKNLMYSLICYLCEFNLEKEPYLISVTEYWLNTAPGTQTLKGDRRKVCYCNYLCQRSCCQSCQFPPCCLSPYR